MSFAMISIFPFLDAALLWHHPVPRKVAGAPYFLLIPFFFAWVVLRGMQRSLSPTLEERATKSYGSNYRSLDQGKRFLILLERLGGRQSTEDDRELDVYRSAAYRLLTFVLILAVCTYWVLAVLRPIANQRWLAWASADAAIWLSSLAIILHTVIRVWVQPDFLGELGVREGGDAPFSVPPAHS
jgi:hypothetical protein